MSAETAPDDTPIGKVVQGRFEVQRRLAAGGMGVVYLAVQQPLGRPVAFKVLELAQGAVDPSFQARFFLEASAAAKLAHPNTIVVHDYGRTEAGQYFIAMEYLDGGSLGDRLDQGPLAPHEAIHVGLQIASSLRDAHQQGLVHRDLKPGNVMFAPRGGDPLFVKVLDFGLVKMVGEGEGANLGLTQSGMMMGSPRYMAPEQVRAQAVDARTDIYSFGALLYHMVAGGPPFHAGSAFEAMQHHVYTPAPPLRQVWAGCPASAELEALILRCLAKQPDERFQSMNDVFQGLRALASMDTSASGYLVPPSGSFPMLDSGERTPPPQFSSSSAPAAPSTDEGVSSSGMRSTRARTARFDPASAPPHTPAPVSAPSGSTTIARPRQTGMLAVVGFLGVLVLGGLAAVGFLVVPGLLARRAAPAEPIDAPAPALEPSPVAVEPPAVEEPPPAPAPTAEPAPAAVALMLRTDPSGATVRRDGGDLGDSPLPLLIPRGERWTLEVSREGYETRTVIVAGGQREVLLHLRETQANAPRPSRPSRPPTIVPEIRPLAPSPQPQPPPRGRRGVYAPDLNDPWAGRR